MAGNQGINKTRAIQTPAAQVTQLLTALKSPYQHQEALKQYLHALDIHREAGDLRAEGVDLHNLGDVHLRLGQPDVALEYFQQALAIHRQVGNRRAEGSTLNSMGQVYSELRLQKEAAKYYSQALTISRVTRNRLGEARALSDLGGVFESIGRFPEALDYFQRALTIYRELGEHRHAGRTLQNLGAVYRSLGLQQEALQHLEQALTAVREIMDTPSEHFILFVTGLVHRDLGQYEQAVVCLEQAVGIFERLRTEILVDELRKSYFGTTVDMYETLIDSLAALGASARALKAAEQAKSRTFLEQLGVNAIPPPLVPSTLQPFLDEESRLLDEFRSLTHTMHNIPDETLWGQFLEQQEQNQAALDDVWDKLAPHAPDYVALRRGETIEYSNLQALVDGFGPNAAVVEFYTLPDKVVVFILRSGEKTPTMFLVPISRDELWRHIQQYRQEITKNPDVSHRSRELGKLLLANVLPYLQGAKLVYLIPHGLLHHLPLHALQVDGISFLDRCPVAYAPSAAVLDRVVRRSEKAKRAKSPSVLVVGNPTLDRPFAGSQAQQVASIFGVRPYLGEKATKARIQSELQGKDVIHLACHGEFDATRPLLSRLTLAGAETLTAQEIMGLDLSADLITLSACETGLSEISPGDELTGLTRALLYAGAASAVVSLWEVEEFSTTLLMGRFYTNYLHGDPDDHSATGSPLTPAQALHRAQIWLRERVTAKYVDDHLTRAQERGYIEDYQARICRRRYVDLYRSGDAHPFESPYYWGAYILCGVT